MPAIDRSSNIREEIVQRSLFAIVPGAIALIIGVTMLLYRVQASVGLAWVLTVLGFAAIVYGVVQLFKLRDVEEHHINCPICSAKNSFSFPPMSDVRCSGCNRQIPILDGRILRVFQVQCGYCKTLNYYSEKSTGLLCESCDRVIPIAVEEGLTPSANFDRFAAKEDVNPYDLILTDPGHHTEQMILVLQKMLALNRNQVKQIIETTPAILLTGIAKMKADRLLHDIQEAGGKADVKVTGT